MKKSTILIIIISSLLSGCGTINTVFRGDDTAIYNLKERRTNCDSIPRIYSGVSYDFCILNASAERSARNLSVHAGLSAHLVDLLLSGTLDTVVLPYTIYRQTSDGSIDIVK
ncbi:YceK/YidQ family lipoprotein [Pseudomonas canadensis]|uniref:YceK/YidQ family lipoprotein n=1 Tax=Pseudomonas canadensis TaxID=915099 RepID=UPI003B9FB8F3